MNDISYLSWFFIIVLIIIININHGFCTIINLLSGSHFNEKSQSEALAYEDRDYKGGTLG
ncbi:hypothetical protein AB733_13055 [Photobacterium swingsii]|nr:hypothetical protein AB733_13055 [Photobacterium swingsii]